MCPEDPQGEHLAESGQVDPMAALPPWQAPLVCSLIQMWHMARGTGSVGLEY